MLDRLSDPPENVIARRVAESVVDLLEVVEVDLGDAIREARSIDVRPHGAKVLLEPAPVAGAGQRVRPCRELQGVMQPLELDHVAVRLPAKAADPSELSEVPDLRLLKQDVPGQTRSEGHGEDDEKVTALVGREAAEVPTGEVG